MLKAESLVLGSALPSPRAVGTRRVIPAGLLSPPGIHLLFQLQALPRPGSGATGDGVASSFLKGRGLRTPSLTLSTAPAEPGVRSAGAFVGSLALQWKYHVGELLQPRTKRYFKQTLLSPQASRSPLRLDKLVPHSCLLEFWTVSSK